MLKQITKNNLTAISILTGAVLTLATPSHAEGINSDLITYSPNAISNVGVNSSGTAYEMKGLMDIAASVKVDINAGISAHVKNWKTWLAVKTENSSLVEFSDDGVFESYPFLNRPQILEALVPLAVPHMTLVPVMVGYCNALADDLRDLGKSNSEIFSQDRTIPIAIISAISANFAPHWAGPLNQADGLGFTSHPKINLICKGRPPAPPPPETAGHFKPPPVDFKVQDIDLFLTTFSGANTQPNAATTCKKGQIKVRLKASKAGNAKFKLWTKVGAAPMTSKVIDAEASFDGAGGYKVEHVEWVSVDKTSTLQAKAEEMVGLGLNTPWKNITLPCTDTGGGGLATNPNTSNPDNPNADGLPQFKTLKGDFSFVDAGSPKCTRKGKALLTFQSPKADNVHYSLDCKENNYSGVIPVAHNPAGGYSGVALVSFDVEKTLHENCTLRTVAPYGPKEHVTKQHLFQCVKRTMDPVTNNFQVPPNPPSDKPNAPLIVVIGTGTSQIPTPPWQCVGGAVMGHNGCVCPPHKKPIYTQVRHHGQLYNGTKCVLSGPSDKTSTPTTGSDSQGVNALVDTKSDAIKRRLEAAKKAAAAKRKREEAASKARKAKAARDAAIAKRKRDAVLAKRKLEAQKKKAAAAVLKARNLKAQQAAAAVLRKRSAAATLARLRAAVAKKRAATSSSGNATQMRIRRRR